VFKGKYTTGGHLRRKEVPRFTQVANAVPPLAARAIGEMLNDLLCAGARGGRSGRIGDVAPQRKQQLSEVTA
jgi:DNA (cytosine-5)-methyltransferase 1